MRRLLAAVVVVVSAMGLAAGQGPAVGLRAGDDFCGDVSPDGNVCGDALANDAVFGLRALDPFSFEFLSDTVATWSGWASSKRKRPHVVQ